MLIFFYWSGFAHSLFLFLANTLTAQLVLELLLVVLRSCYQFSTHFLMSDIIQSLFQMIFIAIIKKRAPEHHTTIIWCVARLGRLNSLNERLCESNLLRFVVHITHKIYMCHSSSNFSLSCVLLLVTPPSCLSNAPKWSISPIHNDKRQLDAHKIRLMSLPPIAAQRQLDTAVVCCFVLFYIYFIWTNSVKKFNCLRAPQTTQQLS